MVRSDISPCSLNGLKGIRNGEKDEETTVQALVGFLTVATLFILIVSIALEQWTRAAQAAAVRLPGYRACISMTATV